MICTACRNPVKADTVVNLEIGDTIHAHCPHCLALLNAAEAPDADGVSVARFERRREIRHRFLDALHDERTGQVLCPLCEHRLDPVSVPLLRGSEHFRCPGCSRDLADLAYREHAYEEGPWLAVYAALTDAHANPECTDCLYLGAAARACQLALSQMSSEHGKQARLLASLVRHPDRKLAGRSCEDDCPVRHHYRQQIGDRMLAL